jgi:hypothetical protein
LRTWRNESGAFASPGIQTESCPKSASTGRSALSLALVRKRQRPFGASRSRSARIWAGVSRFGSKLIVTSSTRGARSRCFASSPSSRCSMAVASGQASPQFRYTNEISASSPGSSASSGSGSPLVPSSWCCPTRSMGGSS